MIPIPVALLAMYGAWKAIDYAADKAAYLIAMAEKPKAPKRRKRK